MQGQYYNYIAHISHCPFQISDCQILIWFLVVFEVLGAGCWLVLLPVEGEGEGVSTLHHSTGAVREEGFLCHRPLTVFFLLSPEDTPA